MSFVHGGAREEAMAKKKGSAESPATVAKIGAINLDITPIEFADAKELRAAYDATDAEVKKAAETSVDGQANVIIALAKMRSLLSQRGGARMRKEAGIEQTWTQYSAWFKKTYDLKMCLRTVVTKIDVLEGKKLCTECRKTNGHTPSCSKYETPPKCLTHLEARLLGTTLEAHDLCQALEQGGNVNAVITEFRKRAPTRERIGEIAQRQSAPYELEAGDLIVVGKQTYTLADIPSEVTTGENGVLSITLELSALKQERAA